MPKRTKLSSFMIRNHSALEAAIASYGVSWPHWAEIFIKRGLIRKPPLWGDDGPEGIKVRARFAQNVRMTWIRADRFQQKKSRAAPADVASMVSQNPTPLRKPREGDVSQRRGDVSQAERLMAKLTERSK
jgi:hypothetical protein